MCECVCGVCMFVCGVCLRECECVCVRESGECVWLSV